MVCEGTTAYERVCRFSSKMNIEKEKVIYEFEVDFKKSFIWRSILSNDDIFFLETRSENTCGK